MKPVREKLTSRGEKRKSDENQEIVNTSVVNDDSRTSANAVLELELNNDQKVSFYLTFYVKFNYIYLFFQLIFANLHKNFEKHPYFNYKRLFKLK